MAIVGIFWWWYGAGWKLAFDRAVLRIAGLYDYFSIDLLLKTLFSPFRQISAGGVDGPINIKIRAFFDQLLSRIIGAIVRLIVIAIGSLTLLLSIIFAVVYLLGWAILPLAPIAGLILALAGWMPWN